ncbi:hypothetical protein DFH08DRAFT_701616 [Mycena albidolilacea]|uniref:Uncharacterized protein n=1 Tax=Mycena albidolilacea TaxID=1033008 RepID=A0AAD6ZZV8_9AGAR|nr:hypothetical protein DFH08DRAFT_701616 [Mycena albidolilacea]
MHLQPPTRFDLSPSNVASTSRLPQTPSRRRGRDDGDENIDPELWSPSKKMRLLYVHLGSTSAGSLLLSSPKLKSYNTSVLPPVIQHVPTAITTPEWSMCAPNTGDEPYKTRRQLEAENTALRKQLGLAHQNVVVRDHIIEEANATMVFQNMGLKKMNEALHQQEEKAATDRAKLFKGKAQCLSSDDFYAAVVAVNAGKKAKEAGKELKRVERQQKKEQRDAIEREWADMKKRHADDVDAWATECLRLLALGTKKKDLPVKPKLGKKPKPPVVDEEESEEEEEVNEDGDGV